MYLFPVCCKRDKEKEEDRNITRILTVRDNQGRILPQATSVQVWRTKDNKIQSFDVLAGGMNIETGGRRRPRGGGERDGNFGYDKLEEDDDTSPIVKSDFNSREESHKLQKDTNTIKTTSKDVVINVADADRIEAGPPGDGSNVVVVRRPHQGPPRPKVTVLEELPSSVLGLRNNSRIYRVIDDLADWGGGGGDGSESSLRLVEALRGNSRPLGGPPRVEIIRLRPGDQFQGWGQPGGDRQQLSYSRHYPGQLDCGGLVHVVEVDGRHNSPWGAAAVDPYDRYLHRQHGRHQHRHRDHRESRAYSRGDRYQPEDDRPEDEESGGRRHRHGRSLSGDDRRRQRRGLEQDHRLQVVKKANKSD